jgi:hypothetical protein
MRDASGTLDSSHAGADTQVWIMTMTWGFVLARAKGTVPS